MSILQRKSADYVDSNMVKTLANIITKETIIVCIGTPKDNMDMTGPMVGSMLKANNIPNLVLGTIEEPVHALSLPKYMEDLKTKYAGRPILSIDACVANSENSLDEIMLRDSGVRPGLGAGKTFEEIGDHSLVVTTLTKTPDKAIYTSNVEKSTKVLCNTIIDAINYNGSTLEDETFYIAMKHIGRYAHETIDDTFEDYRNGISNILKKVTMSNEEMKIITARCLVYIQKCIDQEKLFMEKIYNKINIIIYRVGIRRHIDSESIKCLIMQNTLLHTSALNALKNCLILELVS